MNNENNTVLMLAVFRDHHATDTVVMLLESVRSPHRRLSLCSDPNCFDGNTILHHATHSSAEGSVSAILSHLHPEWQLSLLARKNNDGNTALHLATSVDPAITKVLVNGIDAALCIGLLQVQNHGGDTVLHKVARTGELFRFNHLLRKLGKQSMSSLLTHKKD